MGNSWTSPKQEELDFEFAFNKVEFSDGVLHLKIVPSDQDDHDSDSNSTCRVQTYFIHSVLLAASSPFFRKLLSNGMKESQEKDKFIVKIKASEEAAFIDMLSFIYNKPLKASSRSELLDVLIVADKFEVTTCIKHCIHMLGKLPMTVESALLYLEIPSMVFVGDEVQTLIDEVKKYLASHFRDFTKSQQEAAMEFPLSAVEAILGSDGLQVNSEHEVFDFALKWARLHYPELEERREILTNRLAHFICFENMNCSKLKSIVGCADFDREKMSELVINTLSSKLEAAYGRYLECNNTFPRRVYSLRLVQVVHFKLVQPRCVVYFDLTKQECADLVLQKRLQSQTFCIGGQPFNLLVHCRTGTPALDLYLLKSAAGSETSTLSYHFYVMKKLSKQFTSLQKHDNLVFERGKGWGCTDPFKTSWKNFMSDKSEFFIDGILHLQADITLIS